MTKELFVIGIGPGSERHLTAEAINCLKSSDIIVGYKAYLKQVAEFIEGKETFTSGMKKEVERCTKALDLANEGKKVAMISSGDAGIYGMAGPILELQTKHYKDVKVKVVPGITAMNTGAAALGAPMMHDVAMISLSNLLTPWEVIEKRIKLAGEADFVISFYNPRSHGRPDLLRKAFDFLLEVRSPETPVGVVRHAGRDAEEIMIGNLGDFDDTLVDMNSVVIVGNSHTYVREGRMITPRGYTL